jgi:hypothetical protein
MIENLQETKFSLTESFDIGMSIVGNSKQLENAKFQKLDLQLVELALSEGFNRACVCFPSPEDGNRADFWNVVFSSF